MITVSEKRQATYERKNEVLTKKVEAFEKLAGYREKLKKEYGDLAKKRSFY